MTGATSGIGKAIALALLDAGADVAVTARQAAPLADLVRETDHRILGIRADMKIAGDRERAVNETTARFGPIEVLVNNVGRGQAKNLLELTADDWQAAFEMNFTPAVALVAAVAEPMIERGWGRVLNVSSSVAREPDPLFAPYAAAKAALVNFTQSASKALGPQGVTVNCLLPGIIQTEAMVQLAGASAEARGLGFDEVMARMLRKHPIPVGRLGTVEDIAGAALFLVSEGSSWINGACLVVDGGAHHFAF